MERLEVLSAAEENSRLLCAVEVERDRLSALVSSISDEVWFGDKDNRLTLLNPPAGTGASMWMEASYPITGPGLGLEFTAKAG